MTKLINELNIKVIFIGILLSMIMGAANVYMGLKAGMTVSASIPASVIGMLILKYINKFFNKNNDFVLEANQIQTAASAGESLAAGIIFTMPALIIIGAWQEFNLILTTVIAFTGGLLGILFMIPMREVFIEKNNSNLKYPEGIACASVLKAGKKTKNSKSAQLIIEGTFVGALFKYLTSYVGAFKSTLEYAFISHNKIFYFGSDISPALIAVGYIVKINIAILVFIGGFIAWIIAMPTLGQGNIYINEPLLGAWTIWSTKIRYIGVGAMIIGGIASIYKVRSGLVDAVKILFTNKSTKNIKNYKNLSSKKINFFSTLAILLVASVYYYLTKNITITIVTSITMVIMSFFFTAVASYIVGLVGNSNSPVSGMTITAVMFTGGLLYVFGFSGMNGMIATLGVAAIVCCAACTSGDVCNDLKTGQIVGAVPYKQQIMQIIGVAFAALVMGPTLQLLHNNTPGGIGGRELAAPQAGLFASLVKGFFGNGELPWILVIIGVFIGIVIILIDYLLEKQNRTFRMHIMPIAVGMYLPFGLSIPIFLGGLISYIIDKKNNNKDNRINIDNGILLSSGLIAGESLMGIFLAVIVSFGFNNNFTLESNITVISLVIIIYYIYKRSK